MDNLEAALHLSTIEPPFYSAVEEAQSDMPHPSWKEVLNRMAAIAAGTVPQMQVEDVTGNLRRNVEYRWKRDALQTRRRPP